MTLETIISDFTARLAEVECQCQEITDAIREFENSIGSNGLMINLKLEILHRWILEQVKELYIKHRGRGYVWVSLAKENGVSIQWFDEDEEFIKKACHKSWGKTTFSSNELSEVIVKLEQEVTEGKWANAITWLNLYGRYAGRDFRKLPASFLLQRPGK